MRRLVECVVVFLCLDLLVRTWLCGGVTVPLVVQSGSMAPTLLGPHRDVVCRDCGFGFSCEADVQPASARAVCPNCGFRENALGTLPDVRGDWVLVDKTVLRVRPPKRWEVVAFWHESAATGPAVKRVIGLPGESVELRDGDVYIDGQIQRKPWPVQRALAVLVHDAAHPPRQSRGLPRWRADRPNSAWRLGGESLSHPGTSEAGDIDWISYHHWQRVPGAEERTIEVPIVDDSGHHQTRPRRAEDVAYVTDVLVTFRVMKASGPGRLWIQAWDGREEFRVGVSLTEPACHILRRGGVVARSPPGGWPESLEGREMAVAICDHQAVVALDGRAFLAHPYVPGPGPIRPSPRAVAIGANGAAVEIGELKVYRDVYYARPPGNGTAWGVGRPVQLGPGEYFVLGDNSPFSEDSRTWSSPGVARGQIVGKPVVVHLPWRSMSVLGRDLQVPAPTRIRYIR